MNCKEQTTVKSILRFLTNLCKECNKDSMIKYKVMLNELLLKLLDNMIINIIKSLSGEAVLHLSQNYINLFQNLLINYPNESKLVLIKIFETSFQQFHLNKEQSEIFLNELFMYIILYIYLEDQQILI